LNPRVRLVRFSIAIPAAALLCLWLHPVHAAPDSSASEATTPIGAVTKVCTGCHGMEIVMDTPKDYDAWHDTVQAMIDRGATGTPAELELVMQYLFENMTTVDVNHADAESLQTVLHASPATVASIVARRQAHAFKDLNDLEAAIPGLDRAALNARKRLMFFQ
jgi:hypothetical protein